MDFSSEFLFLAAPNYEAMFKTLLVLDQRGKPQVSNAIGWAKEFLKKQDRIFWFLRWVRAYLATFLVESLTIKYPDKSWPTAATNFVKAIDRDMQMVGAHSFENLKHDLTHYLSLPIADIQNKVFRTQTPDELFAEFDKMEGKFLESRRGLLLPKPEDKIVMQFPDGWAWWQLPRASCKDEADAMGHCGNSPQAGNVNQNILSIRQPRKVGTQTWWEPHATFILNSNGYLGEMKGKQNAKPVPRLHPYIVALLKLKK